jgi:hypothetical protein
MVKSQIQNPELGKVIATILNSAHRSKLILISDKHPQFDPVMFRYPTGAKKEETLRGLVHTKAIQFLHQIGLKLKDRKLLRRIADYCDGNPHMMQIFCYFVDEMHRDPDELLTSSETAAKFGELLSEVIEDLSEESRSVLEFISILRLPLERKEIQLLGIRYGSSIGPLLDRFLVFKERHTQAIHISTAVRDYVHASLPELRKRELHRQAADMYRKYRQAL